MATNPKFTDVSNVQGTDFDNADGTSLKGILTAGSGGTRVESISIVSDEAVVNDLMLYIYDTTTDHPVGHIDIPINSGTDGTANAVSGLNGTNLSWLLSDINGNKYLNIPANFRLKAKMRVTVTATETVNVVVFASDY